MRNKVKTIDTTVRTEKRENDGIDYTYRLIMTESANVASYKIPLYSISVNMVMSDGSETDASTRDLFADAGKAIDFFEKLVDNLATPIDLPYIVEDEFTR